MRHPFGETVIIHPMTLGGVDEYNNPVEGFGPDILRPNCAVQPRTEEEESACSRSTVVNGFQVFDTVDCPAGPHDEVTVRGVRYKVDGEVARWSDPFTGKQRGAAFLCKRIEG